MGTINPEHVQLHDPYKFDERFVALTSEYDTYEEAYEAVEKEYKSVFKTSKYSNYNSYRMARKRRIQSKV